MQTIDGKSVYSVSEANYFARQTLEQMELWVVGEITTFKQNPSWRFFYLDLKDDKACLPCVADGKVFDGVEGDMVGQKILAYGFLSLYEPRGQYQFKISRIETAGDGILQKQLQELIKKLKGEGLFDQEHKKLIPQFPRRVCVVTSQGSDAWNDFKRHTVDKFPIIEVVTADVRVQGVKSVTQLLKILPKVDSMGFDIIVITRGGGSLEDLAAFNDEQVARAIFAMKTPTVVAIGHEANESLAEWVSDRRASTPTDAANIVTCGYAQVLEKLLVLKHRLKSKSISYFSTYFQTLDHNYRQLLHMRSYFKDLPYLLASYNLKLRHSEKFLILDAYDRLALLKSSIFKNAKFNLETKETRLGALSKNLQLLSPDNVLLRGYSITTNEKGEVIKSIGNVVAGETLGVRLHDGKLRVKLTEKIK